MQTRNIVDKAWFAQQSNKDVVDTFSTLKAFTDKFKTYEAMAAVSYNSNGAFAYSASGGTSVSPAYPTSIAANDLLILTIGMKPSTANGGSVTTPSGWTPIVSLTGAGGYGTTLGADTGNTNIFTFYKVAAGTETGNLAVTIATNGVSWAQISRLSNASGSWSVAGTTGSDTSAGSVSIAFGADPGVTGGDYVLGAMVIPTNVTTPAQFSAEAFSQSGITFGTVTEIGEADTTTGNDIGGFRIQAPVSSGTSAGVPTMTATAGGTTTNVRGPGAFIRVRETNTAPTLTVTQPDGTGDTVTVGDLYNITYDLADPDPKHAVTAAMYYDTDAVGLNGTAITGACATAAEGTGATCSWDTTGMTPGTYYVYGITNDGIAAQVNDYSPGVITINAPANTTTIGDGTDPGNSTVAPSSAITDLDAFTLVTSGGVDSVTALTVTLTGASSFESLSEVRITSDNGATLYFAAVANPASNTVNFSGGTPIPVSTSATQFKVRITPKTHANMPVPPGLSYAVGGTVTAFTSTNTQAGNDATTPATITVDNLSPSGATAVSGVAGDAANAIDWTTSGSADFNTTGGSVVLRWAAVSAGSEVPAEGNSSYTAGNTISTATVACVISSAASTAQSKVDGTGGSAGCTTAALTNGQAYTYKVFQQDTNGNYDVGVLIGTFTPAAPTITLTVGVNNSITGGQYANLDSGSANAWLGGAFTFSINTGSAIVSGIRIDNNGTAGNLSDIHLFYDTTNNGYSGGDTCFTAMCNDGDGGTLGTTINGALSMTAGTTYYVYVLADIAGTVAGGLTVDLQIANPSTYVTTDAANTDTAAKNITGTTTIRPNITSFSNSTEPALTDGARETQIVSISGAGFGATCNIAGGNKVSIGAYDLSCTGATFSNTTITIAVDSALPDTNDGGTGASGLLVTVGSTPDDARQTFYTYPTISGVIDDFGGANDTAREYDAADNAADNTTADMKDGEIQINGIHFGSSGTVTVLGQIATQAVIGTRCSSAAYTATCITVRVPTAIGDGAGGASDYVGSVVVNRGGSITHSLSGFRILPRITGLSPGSGAEGAAVQVQGNHLCQSGTCPTGTVGEDADIANAPAFSANDRITFSADITPVVATYWGANWSHGATPNTADTKVPTGAAPGNVVLKSNGYDSNPKSFTVLQPAPTTPTTLWQSRNQAFTDLIATGGIASTTTVYFSATSTSGVTGGTIYQQVEMRPTTGGNSTFSSPSACSTATCTSTGYCFEGPGFAYSGGNITATSSTTTIDGLYHWQTRTRYNLLGVDYCSAWQCYPDTGCNAETAIDLEVDATAPAITILTATNITTNGATITWDTAGDSSSSQVAYGTDAALVTGTATSTETDISPTVVSHAVAFTNLSCGTTYYYRARSRDDAGLVSFSAIQNFLTSSCPSTPAKTATFHIVGKTATVTNASPLSQPFTVSIPETATTTKSAFVEITGVYNKTSTASNGIAVQVDAQGVKTYALPPYVVKSHFRVVHRVSPVNASHTLSVTPPSDTTIFISSAKLIVTYSYTP